MRINLAEVKVGGPALPLSGSYTWKLIDLKTYKRDFNQMRKSLFGSGQVFVVPNLGLFRPNKDRLELYFGVYLNEEPVAWTFGYSGAIKSEFEMLNTGVSEAHRGKGIYSAILNVVIAFVKLKGITVIKSKHRANNNGIIIPKLKAGFTISGMEIAPRFGTMVNLEYYYSPLFKKMVGYRTGTYRLDEELAQLMPKK
jgi:GNAT superfamily N-acetyltransferase